MTIDPRIRSALPVCGLLAAVLAMYALVAQGMDKPVPLGSVARALIDEPAPMRADFAWLVIAEMATVYAEEAERARTEAGNKRNSRNLRNWSNAVQAFSDDLASLANEVNTSTPVSIRMGAGNQVHLYIDGTPVIVGSPNGSEQAAFEQRVLERFCSLHRCDTLVLETPLPVQLTNTRDSTARWSFSQHAGPVCMTDTGLEFQFRDTQDLRERRDICEQAVLELNVLATGIAKKKLHGTWIDWNALVIHTSQEPGQYQVLLNGQGDEIRLSLPVLAARADLFRIVRPWLAARVDGNEYNLVVLNAGRLF